MALTTIPVSLSATALTLTTAAQPNITSVGTLTGLAVTGNATITKESPTLTLTDSSSSRTLLHFVDDNNSVVRASGPLLLQSGGAVTALTLDASRNATFAGNLTVSTSGNTELTLSGDFPRLYFVDTAGSDLDAYIVNNANGLFFGKTNSPTVTNDVMMLDLTNQRVGIGVSTPGAPLEIKSTDDPQLILHHTEASDNAAMHFKHGGTTNGHIYVNNDRTMYFSTVATNPAMVIKVGGNVGIGTGATANYRLDLMDTIADQDPILYMQASGTPADAFNWIAEFMAPNIAQDKRVTLALGKARSSNNAVTMSYVQRADTNYNALTFGHFGNNDLVSFCYNGNVGIGLTDPAALLNVDVGAPSSTDQTLGLFQSQTSRRIGFVWDDSASTLGVATLTSHPLVFHVGGNSSEKMRIDTSGNVGIGDNNPDRKLSIIGDSTSGGQYPLSLDATNTDYIMEFRRSGTSEWWFKASASNFTIHENGVADQFSIYSGSARVHGLLGVNKGVNAAVGLSVGADSTATNSYGLEVCNANANTRFLVDGVGSSFFYKSDNALGMKFDASSGNFGIGESGPAFKLQLGIDNQSLGAVTTNKQILMNIDGGYSTSGSRQYKVIGFTGTTSGGTDDIEGSTYTSGEQLKNFYIGLMSDYAYFNSSRFSIIQGGAERFTITQAGKVGIGPAVADDKFHTHNTSAENWRFENGTSGSTGKIYLKTTDNSDMSKYLMMSSYWTEIGVHNNEGLRVRGSDGNIKLTLTGAAGNLSVAGSGSDRNFKKDIEDIDTAVDIIKAAKPKTFEFIKHVKRKAAGFIAQDMQEILPDLVSGEEYDEEIESSGLGFDYIGYTAYLTKALQESIARIETLEVEVAALKEE